MIVVRSEWAGRAVAAGLAPMRLGSLLAKWLTLLDSARSLRSASTNSTLAPSCAHKRRFRVTPLALCLTRSRGGYAADHPQLDARLRRVFGKPLPHEEN